MKKRQFLVIAFSLTALLTLRASDKADAGARRAEFEKATAAFDQALRTNDAGSLFAYVADDVIMMPPNEAPIRGKAAMETWYRTFLSAFRTTALILTDVEINVSESWATTAGQYEWRLQPTAGGDPVVEKGHYMQIWKRGADGNWRFSREIWNSSIPAAATSQSESPNP